jgi:[FeFe] hydrogenase H-cluster maturation GTPase HydF
MSLQSTPNASRIQIGIFGKVNSGKSTLLNALTSQQVALVSDEKGTTTDPVYKTMEIHGLGPVVFIDTAGYQDRSKLGEQRLEKTKLIAKKVDIAIILFNDLDIEEGISWITYFKEQNTKTMVVVNDMENNDVTGIVSKLKTMTNEPIITINALQKTNIDILKEELIKQAPEETLSITGNLVTAKDIVMLVMPQDLQAPKGRLILPQVQTIRELLDKKCIVVSCVVDAIEETLQALKQAPKLIICDSQVFKIVYDKKPKESKLTSFSVLFAGYKGDINSFVEGAKAIATLNDSSHVLISEACMHAPLSEDIGRVKIPRLLRKRFGEGITIDMVSGIDFLKDIKKYDLIIHCGACMFNRKYVLSRLKEAKEQGIPMTNYGITMAYLQGILEHVSW